MIDIRLVRETPDAVRASQRARGEDPGVVDAILAADEARRSSLAQYEAARARQKAFGKEVAAAKGEEKQALLAQVKELAEQVKALDSDAVAAQGRLDALMRTVGNVIIDGVPAGGEEDGERLGAIDLDRGAKVSGARFYFLTGPGARLELGLLHLAIDRAVAHGFVPMVTPTLVTPQTMAGAGFLDSHADEVYHLPADDLYLTGTSEVALTDGPKRYAGWSACYRREAGSHGKDTKGIIRVHQFHKVEMFVYCRVEDAAAEHDRLLAMEQDMLTAVELPYRVIDVAAGDLGGPAARKFDCEAWVPTQGRYREVTSTSNCTTFQARRLGTRERDPQDAKGATRVVATLNGTLATTRWIVAILENHQQADGSVRVPEALRPYVGLDVIAPRR